MILQEFLPKTQFFTEHVKIVSNYAEDYAKNLCNMFMAPMRRVVYFGDSYHRVSRAIGTPASIFVVPNTTRAILKYATETWRSNAVCLLLWTT